jgi:aminoglycoside phosphotransferase (APT) family kinase protein
MNFRSIERAADAFQQPCTVEQVDAMCRRAFGDDVQVRSVVELGWGAYNNTYRVDIGQPREVVLRVAPEPGRQLRTEREFMRNEYASIPYFASVASLLPRTLAVDFTHQLIGRDYLFQTLLDGVPAPDGLAAYPRPEWAEFFRQLGTIARTIHDVRGDRFGRVAGPTFATWTEALIDYFTEIAADLNNLGLHADDAHRAADAAARHRVILDEITEPRLLHGDLWTVNVMVEPNAPEPTVTGVCDCDRVWWGDPRADWVIYRAHRRPGTERDAFWDTYGQPVSTPESELRWLIYRARHAFALRLSHHQMGHLDEIPGTYDEVAGILAELS